MGFWLQYFSIVFLNYFLHVLSDTVTYFDCFPVDYGAQNVVFGEVFVNDFEEFFANVGFEACIKGGIVPNDVSFPVSFRALHTCALILEFGG